MAVEGVNNNFGGMTTRSVAETRQRSPEAKQSVFSVNLDEFNGKTIGGIPQEQVAKLFANAMNATTFRTMG